MPDLPICTLKNITDALFEMEERSREMQHRLEVIRGMLRTLDPNQPVRVPHGVDVRPIKGDNTPTIVCRECDLPLPIGPPDRS